MPTLKTTVDREAKSGFETYDGPDLVPGSYVAEIRRMSVRSSQNSGNVYLNGLFVVREPKGSPKEKYDGAETWGMIHLTENENIQARYASFLKAIGSNSKSTDVNIVHESEDEINSAGGSQIKKIDGINPIGRKVKITLRAEGQEGVGYGVQIKLDTVTPVKKDEAEESEDVEMDEDGVDEDDVEVETEEDEISREDREKELKKESLADLKAAAKEAEIDIKGMKKGDLITAILDWEYEDAEEDEDEDDEEEEEVDEDDVEVEDEEEEEDDDAEEELREELSSLDRAALKARLKKADSDAKVFKKTTDDEIRDQIVALELNAPPF